MSEIDSNLPAGVELLSKQAIENVEGVDYWKPLVAALADPWSPSNPEGMVILGVAENALMQTEVREHIKQNFEIDPAEHFSYGHGPQGSPRLRNALSEFFKEHFQPIQNTASEEFVITTGVTALIDHLTWSICNPGEGILLPQPLYAGFTNDIPTRARGQLVPVPFIRDDGTHDLNDVFSPDSNTRCLERAFEACSKGGVRIRGVMITNPHNPLGKCYPEETLKAIARFCARHNLHYLSDEIYALSVFDNREYPDAVKFKSILSIPLDDILDPLRVHVLYGMAKDFGANGLRLGALHSRNKALCATVAGIAAFGWQAYLVQDMWARMLEDKLFLQNFVSENQKRLSERYIVVTNFLRENGIPFFEGGNAGVFVWLDLRQYLVASTDLDEKATLKVADLGSTPYKILENELTESCWKKKVMISKGSGCLTEEYGWFRIVFTVEEEALHVGLARFLEGLNETFKRDKGYK